MHSQPAFHLFGQEHLVVIFLTIFIPLALGIAVRITGSARVDRAVAICLALLLLTNYFGYAFYLWQHQLFAWQKALPFQLCDWAMVTVIVALFTERRSWIELSYFWGIAGTFNAILTPNLQVGFPDIRFISFFVGHCGIVSGVIYLMIVRRFRPTLGSVWRTLAWSQLYLVVALLVDYLTGVNYGFLLHKPEAASILDYLSDTHWLYIMGLEGLALLFFALLYAPFALARLFKTRGNLSDNPVMRWLAITFLTQFVTILASQFSLAKEPDPSPPAPPVDALIPWLLREDTQLRGIPFAKVIFDTTGKRVIAIDPQSETDQRVIKQISTALGEVVRRLNEPGSAIENIARINEVSSHFEDLLRQLLNSAPGLSCDFPHTAENRVQRSGYPDLRVVDKETKRVFYLDPKLYVVGSRESSFRTFYFEPKTTTNKVLDDAVHLVAGFEHETGKGGQWKFTRWDLVDLSHFEVKLKAEFQGSNRDMYRREAIVATSAK